MAGLRKFVAPEFVFGNGAMDLVPRYTRNLGGRRPLLVSDPGVEGAGWTGQVAASLEEAGIDPVLFTRIRPNPRIEEVSEGAVRYQDSECDIIIAVGGGSAMDCAKGIGILVSGGGEIQEYEGVDTLRTPCPPLVCVPTTAGSASEVSQFAILSDRERRLKFAIISKALVPDIALIDPDTLSTVDSYLAACTGIDALSHAIEALFSTAASPITDLHAIAAIQAILKWLPRALDPCGPGATGECDPTAEAREGLMFGSLQAGLAFSNASLGAVHALAHSLGGLLDLPHGECNALLLPSVLGWNAPANPLALYRLAACFGQETSDGDAGEVADKTLGALRRFIAGTGIEGGLGTRGLEVEDIKDLASAALLDPCMATNPRRATHAEVAELYGLAL